MVGVLSALALALLPTAFAHQSSPRRADAAASRLETTCCTLISLPSLHLADTFSTQLTLSLARPAGYVDSAPGIWSGPTYIDSKKPALQPQPTVIKWFARVDRASQDAETAAKAFVASADQFTQVRTSAPVDVQQLLADGKTFPIQGFSLLLQTATPTTNGQYEGVLAFPLGLASPIHASAPRGPYFVVARFIVRNPASDRYLVGSDSTAVPAPTWNAQQIATALAGITLQGSMPPAAVSANTRILSSTKFRTRVSGVVSDSFGHPVGDARVTLLRQVVPPAPPKSKSKHKPKPKFVVVTSTASAAAGTYTLFVPRVLKRGVYTLTVELAKSIVTRTVMVP